MKIGSSTVEMGSTRNYRENSVTFRRFTMATVRVAAGGSNALNAAVGGNTGNAGNADSAGKGSGNAENAQAQEDGENKVQEATLQDWQSRLQPAGSNVTFRSAASQTLAEIRQTTIRYIFDLLFSYRRSIMDQWRQANGLGASGQQASGSVQNTQNVQQGNGEVYSGDLQQRLNASRPVTNIRVLNYSQDILQIEKEETAFSTVGTVCTADGREIKFNVNVGMSRELQQYYQEKPNTAAFVFCDPLVINLDTDITELSDQTFYFDIDADGELDEISGMGAGSGYLALDKNGDGVINDGNELFGTSSGNGFADLAKYDEDGNGWIDENDAIWDKLKIWCKDENGQDVLYKLADKGVGAICLQNVSTDFTLKSQEGRTKGAIRNSGVFLYENGNVGTVQHVDVAKYSAQA